MPGQRETKLAQEQRASRCSVVVLSQTVRSSNLASFVKIGHNKSRAPLETHASQGLVSARTSGDDAVGVSSAKPSLKSVIKEPLRPERQVFTDCKAADEPRNGPLMARQAEKAKAVFSKTSENLATAISIRLAFAR